MQSHQLKLHLFLNGAFVGNAISPTENYTITLFLVPCTKKALANFFVSA